MGQPVGVQVSLRASFKQVVKGEEGSLYGPAPAFGGDWPELRSFLGLW